MRLLLVEMRPEKNSGPYQDLNIYKISAIGKSVSGLQRFMY